MSIDDQADQLQEGIRLFGANEIKRATLVLEQVVNLNPENAVAIHFLGLCKHREGQSQQALDLLLTSIQKEPRRAAFHSNLGLLLADLNELDRAIESFSKAVALDPHSAQTQNNFGNVLQRKGCLDKAVECFKKALSIDPNFFQALNNLAGALARIGRTEEAIETFERALHAAPTIPEIHCNLGMLYLSTGKSDAADGAFREALRLRPEYSDAMIGLARALKTKGGGATAIDYLIRSIAIQPSNAKAHLELGHIFKETGRIEEALDHYGKARMLDANNFYAQWNACLTLPILYRKKEEILEHRQRWREGVERMLTFIETECASSNFKLPFAAPHTNFYLHYQGLNDLEEQKKFAKIISRLASRTCPRLLQPIRPRPCGMTKRIRIGFISSFFSLHTVFKLFHGWIKNLDRELFEAYTFHLGTEFDKASKFTRDHSDAFFSQFRAPEEIIQKITASELDVLIYPEIGMDPVTQSLAALRLAPIQCVSWGHPVTSGLETIDYFLSSALMELPSADSHYSEKLVRLPNLSICYPPPDTSIAQVPELLGAPDKIKTRFLCLQSLFKLLPQYDDLYPRIVLKAPESEFWFIGLDSMELTEMFHRRLVNAFSKHNLNSERHVRFFPKMKIGTFFGLVQEADVILDSVGWSGGNTTLEAIAFNKPVVTLPGEMMRSRHSSAIFEMMGITETIAKDFDDYVAISARLALDESWRSEMADRVRVAKSRVYNDRKAVKGLEQFLFKAVTNRSC